MAPSCKKSQAVPLSPTAEKKLFAYSALASATGVGVLALVQPSEAEIVYTPAHQKLTGSASFQLDLNGDGITDFTFFANTDRPGVKTFSTRTSVAMSVYGAVNTNQAWVNARNSVSALSAGVSVGPNGKFGSGRFMGGVSARENGPGNYFGPWAPEGGQVKNHYVGLKFVIDGEVHFGWARFNVQMRKLRRGGVTALMTGYAYETEANTPIITGKTSGTNAAMKERGTLGQLAVGATALVAWRREAEAGVQERPRLLS